jgi:tRNA 2-thiouridine synthesizing protein D
MMASSILVLITKPPYGLEDAFAGLRLGLAMAVNGMKTSVLFMEEGVYNAIGTQKADVLKMPSNIDATKDLYEFDVPVYVVSEDLAARGIQESRLFEGLKVIPATKARDLIAEHDSVTTF